MRTLLTFLTVLIATPILGMTIIVASWLRVPDRPDGIYDRVVLLWCRLVVLAAGTKVVVHGRERMAEGAARIYACNHVSWFDVLALAVTVPRHKFVAKAELFKIPIFGRGIRAAGMVEIHRENRKAAFEAYRTAAARIGEGDSVIVFPEGTRGLSYAIRPFKKGPFVLAVAAGVPIVPTVVHGTIEINAKGSFRVRGGRVDVHFLEPVPTTGLVYSDRNVLCETVRSRMADAMRGLYGVESLGEGANADDPVESPSTSSN